MLPLISIVSFRVVFSARCLVFLMCLHGLNIYFAFLHALANSPKLLGYSVVLVVVFLHDGQFSFISLLSVNHSWPHFSHFMFTSGFVIFPHPLISCFWLENLGLASTIGCIPFVDQSSILALVSYSSLQL